MKETTKRISKKQKGILLIAIEVAASHRYKQQ